MKKQPPPNQDVELPSDVYRHCPHCSKKTKHVPDEPPPEVCAHCGKGLLIPNSDAPPRPTTHTPGPWKASTRHRSSSDDAETAVAILPPFGPHGSAKTAIARVLLQQISPGQYDREQMHANAALIAAAPDLLTELEGLRIVLAKLHDKYCKDEPVPAVLASLALADLAIKKAKGETP